MKVGAVLGVQVAIVCMFALTQGCVTTESQGSGRGAGARRKGPWRHEHKGKVSSGSTIAPVDSYTGYEETVDPISESPLIIESAYTDPVDPMSAPVATTDFYIVKKGDILSQLASDFDTTTATLVEMNALSNPDVLYVGQELRVPAGRGGSPSVAPKSTSSIKRGGSYTIQKGDTLSGIASSAGVSLADLRSLNHINDDRIIAGATLDIPEYGKVPSSTKKSVSKKTTPAPVVESAEVEELAPAPMDFAPAVPEVDPVGTDSMSVDMVLDHVVYPGQTLDAIALEYAVAKAEIMRLNNITDETAVREGQRLRIPIAE